jgi:hypothetical protein
MTPHVGRLLGRLTDINDRAARTPPASDLAAITAELRAIRAYMNGSMGGAGAARDRIHEALLAFWQTGLLADARDARLVCWGITLARGADEVMLIEDGERFPDLLDCVDDFRADPKPYRRCWRGLLDGYFSYDSNERRAGQRNWSLLRDYLWDNRAVTRAPGFQPDWATAMVEHANLLTEDPCSRYGAALFDGDTGIIDALRSHLGITDASWVMRELVDAQVTSAISRGDSELRAITPRLLALLEQHRFLQDVGLARVLDRYSGCDQLEVNTELKDHTVAKWGNPWLEHNEAKWGRVTSDSRKMIADWLKLDFIRTFFSLLSADQMNDQRRLRFWERYVGSIDKMYFALGDTAYRNPSPDFKKARHQMAGRLLELDQSGGANNNAFIMTIKGHVFVEFGEKGNALYVFDGNNLPFDLSGSWISGDRSALKSHAHVARAVHIDSSWKTWEQKCEQIIAELTGVRPDGAPSRRAPTQPAARASAPPQTYARSTPLRAASVPSEAELFALLASRNIKHLDMREKGGSLWVYAPLIGSDLPAILRKAGFAWSARRDAWYAKQA